MKCNRSVHILQNVATLLLKSVVTNVMRDINCLIASKGCDDTHRAVTGVVVTSSKKKKVQSSPSAATSVLSPVRVSE